MKKTKFRRLAVMTASLLCCLIFTVPAYAQSNEPQPEATPAPVETEAEPETQTPFTPDGTGTVVDKATDEDGKEFYTITTADESVFYLVIDKQKTSENVYFLNAVTVDDLLPLAEQGEEPAEEVTPRTGAGAHRTRGGSDRAGTRTRGRKNRQPASLAALDRGGGADRRRCRLLLQDLQAEARSAGLGGRLLRI